MFSKSVNLPIIENTNNETQVVIPDFLELNEKAGLGRMVRAIFSTPFDLKYYTITIKDTSEYIGSTCAITYNLLLDGKPFPPLPARSKTKMIILANDEKVITLPLLTQVNVTAGDCPGGLLQATIHFEASAKPSWYDTIAKLILVFLAWNGGFFLCWEVYKFVK